MQRRQFVTSILATSLVVLSSGSPARAGVEPTPFRTGLFGVTAGQAIRVSVVDLAGQGSSGRACQPSDPAFPPDPIRFVVRIFDLSGKVLFQSRGKPLSGSMGAFVDFQPVPEDGIPSPTGALTPGPALTAVRNRRQQVRVEVVIAPIPDDGTPVPEDGEPVPDDGLPVPEDGRDTCGGVLLSLEVFDIASGRTGFTIPFVKVAFNPQPEPPEPMRVSLISHH